jgi:hypothetical protein
LAQGKKSSQPQGGEGRRKLRSDNVTESKKSSGTKKLNCTLRTNAKVLTAEIAEHSG